MESDPKQPADSPAGDVNLDAVVAAHAPALLRYVTRLLNNASIAQDIVQETFLRLWRRAGAWPAAPRALSAWLYRTAHNTAVDHIRRETRLRRLHETQADDPAVGPGDPPVAPAAALDEVERRRLALEHLARLAPAERQVLLLRLQEGLSYREISLITGRSEGNVGCLLHHATQNLAARLRQAGVN